MKAIYCLLFACFLAGNSFAQPIRFDKANEYNDFIIGEQTKVGQAIKEFMTVNAESNDSTVIHNARNKIAIQADSAIARLKRLVGFRGDTAFKGSSMRLFGFYASTARVQYAQLVRYSFRTDKNDEALKKEMMAVVNLVIESEKKFDSEFSQAQKAFAAKNNFTLTENTSQPNQ